MSGKPSTQAMLKEWEATHLLADRKTSPDTVAGIIVALTLAAGVAGWMAAGAMQDHDRTQVFYRPDASPPIGERLKDGPALVRSGGILLLSSGTSCPPGSVQLSDVAIQVIRQRTEQFGITTGRTPEKDTWKGRTFKTCKI